MINSTGLLRRFSPPLLRLGGLLILTIVLLGLQSASVGHAAPTASHEPCPAGAICVNTFQDSKKAGDKECSLREAVITVNNNGKPSGGHEHECHITEPGPDDPPIDPNKPPLILLKAGTYELTRSDNGNEDAASTGDLDFSKRVEIQGQGFGQTIINSSAISDRAIHVVSGGDLTLVGVTVTKNGGVVDGDGGGLYNGAVLTLIDSTVSDNHAIGKGGGIFNSGVLTVINSTIGGIGDPGNGTSGNIAEDKGGAIANASSGSVTLDNSTVSGNSAVNEGSGIFNEGVLLLNNATIASNSANNGGGVVNFGDTGTVNVRNTIIDSNGPNCSSGVVISQGYNLVSDDSCGITDGSNGDQINSSPGLGELADNGGPTLTHALLVGSPAIDAGNPAGCFGSTGIFAFDQRGEIRPVDGDNNGTVQCDIGAFEFGRGGGESALVLIRAFPNDTPGTTVHGLFDGFPDTSIDVSFFSTCAADISDFFHTASDVPTDANGYFVVDIPTVPGQFVTAKANDPDTGTLRQSNCVPVSDRNDDWPNAVRLFPEPTDSDDTHFIDSPGQSRWYKFKVEPHSELTIILSGTDGTDDPLPADYDITLYSDLQAAFDEGTSNPDLVQLSAQFAGTSYSGTSYSGTSYSGTSYSGTSYSGTSYSGTSYSGTSYSGTSYSGTSYSDAIFGGTSYSEAYSDAQARSLLAVSAIGGTAQEIISLRTWNSDEDYYVRVRSSNGEFSLDERFRIEVTLESTGCDIDPLPGGDPIGPSGNPTTLILYDSSRLDRIEGSDTINVVAKLNTLAAAVDGQIVDVNDDPRVQAANNDADDPANVECPVAKNHVAQTIRDIVDGYRTQPDSALRYVVIVGHDGVIPFFRHPDFADVAKESQFFPPVDDDSPSQATLRLDYVLSDNDYIAERQVELGNSIFPIVDPRVAIGRMVETASDISAVIDAFLDPTYNGVVTPQSSLVTGYDFLEDASVEIENQLRLGTGSEPDDLITSFDVPPTDPSAWTADQLRNALLDSRHDVVFLAGHFSADSALAADYTTQMWAAEITDPALPDDLFTNTIFFGPGCHMSYNTINEDGIPGVTVQPDWTSAILGQGGTVVGSTGYGYGETLTKEYSERLFIEFSKRIRRDTGGPISIGHALTEAKLAYITQVPTIRGMHEKVLLETTLFGLPMLSVDMPGERENPPEDTSVITNLNSFTTNPGLTTGLQYADLSVTSPLNVNPVQLRDVDTDTFIDGEFLSGDDDGGNEEVVTFPTEPFLPLEVRNVSVPGTVLRGVGFRGGSYEDVPNILPVTGAPTTEAIALHLSWQTDYLHPTQMHNSNYLGALISLDGRPPQQRILFTPAQHIAGDTIDGIRLSNRRQFSQIDYRLFYNGDLTDFDGHIPALSAPPSIIHVSAIPGTEDVLFRMTVVGDPAAGMQSVWVTWTDGNGIWQSLDLTQRESDTRIWEETLPLNDILAQDIRYMVQAVNGFGLVSIAMADGNFYTPGVDSDPTVVTDVQLAGSNPTSGVFEDLVDFSATLTADGQPLEGQVVDFRLGPGLSAQGVTDSSGTATVTLNLLLSPDDYKLYAAFDGDGAFKASSTVADFTIEPQQPEILNLASATIFPGEDSGIQITLVDENGEPLREQSVFIVITPQGADPSDPDNVLYAVARITDLFGNVSLGTVPLPSGFTYDVTVYFNSTDNPLTSRASSDAYEPAIASTTLTILQSSCNETVTPNAETFFIQPDGAPSIWPPNGDPVDVDISLNDPSGQLVITIDSIEQDEPVGSQGPDGIIVSDGTPTARIQLRAERDGSGDGRVYFVTFTATSPGGFSCQKIEVPIPVVSHDQATDPDAFDSGDRFDSTEEPKNDPPVADDDSNTTDEDTLLVVATEDANNVLVGDTDKDPHDVLEVVAVNGDTNAVGSEITLPSGALLTLNADGSYSYNPNGQFDHVAAGAADSDTFTYDVGDGNGGTDTATVTINITGVNDAPVANDDSASVDQGGTVTVLDSGEASVLANDTDLDAGDALTATPVSGPSNGNLTLNPDGTFSYTHDNSLTTSDSFTYETSDGNGGTATATVNISISTLNQAPDAVDDTATVDEGGTVTEVDDGSGGLTDNLLANDSDPDGDNLTVNTTPVSGPSNGSLILNADGTFSYEHDGSETTSDSFVYEVCDDGAPVECSTATVTITINPVNDAPVANDDPGVSLDTNVNPSVDINVIANDTDADGTLDPTTVTTTDPSNGQVNVNSSTGVVTYTPNPGFNGQDSFTYTVKDNLGFMSNVATVTVTVTSNQSPDAKDDEITTTKGKDDPVIIDVLIDNGNGPDTDPEGDPLTVISFTQGAKGEVTSNDNGTLTYTPASSFKGTDSFEYTISDGKGGTDTATVFITTTN